MKLLIEINLDGAAFDCTDDVYRASDEVKRILVKTIDRRNFDIRFIPGDSWELRDINGNPCGSVKVEE